jgi:hypothetical protein
MLDTPPVARLLVASTLLGAVAGAATLLPSRTHTAEVASLSLRPTAIETAPSPVTVAAREPAAPPADPSEVFLVFRAGGHTYMQLDAEAVPHGAPRLSHSDDDGLYASIAPVTRVPAEVAAWTGKHVIVDGTCAATVEGFAMVSRLLGDTGYAGIDDRWTARNVMEQGTPVLAARLSGCNGTLARDASLPAAAVFSEDATTRTELVQAASERVLGSAAATAVQAQWDERRDEWPANEPSRWTQSPSTHVDTRVLRHPSTGVTWIAVHASREDGCGGIDANVFGLFRVTASGTLETVALRELGDLHSIQTFVDLDGDGTPELA